MEAIEPIKQLYCVHYSHTLAFDQYNFIMIMIVILEVNLS